MSGRNQLNYGENDDQDFNLLLFLFTLYGKKDPDLLTRFNLSEKELVLKGQSKEQIDRLLIELKQSMHFVEFFLD